MKVIEIFMIQPFFERKPLYHTENGEWFTTEGNNGIIKIDEETAMDYIKRTIKSTTQ